MQRTIFITDSDRQKLRKLIDQEKEFGAGNTELLQDLELEIERACVKPSGEIPHDVITMCSTVLLRDMDSGEKITYTLVYPPDSNLTEGKISVLAPVGTAILGYREGDILSWAIPDGTVRLEVEKVLYQPEAYDNRNF